MRRKKQGSEFQYLFIGVERSLVHSRWRAAQSNLELPSLFTAKGENCHSYFCRTRAEYSGAYKKVPAQCLTLDLKLAQFKQRYASQNFKETHVVLESLIQNCTQYVFWVDGTQWINDLAITRFHLGDLKGCLTALEPLKEIYILAAENQSGIPGIKEEEWFNRISKAARFNWQKCGGKLPTSLNKP